MKVNLPAFENTRLKFITICGRFERDISKTCQKFLPEKPLIISYRAGHKRAYIKVLPWASKCGGVHIDCALHECFPKKYIPIPNGTRADLGKIFHEFDGSPIDANIDAAYEIPLMELLEEGLVRSLLAKHKTGNLTIRLTGATCKLEGTPVRELEWSLEKNEKNVLIRIDSLLKEKIDDGYLIRSFKWVENLFSIFVLGKAADDRTP